MPVRPATATRVLLVMKAGGVGGAERSMINLFDMLTSRGIACELVTLRGRESGRRLLAELPETLLAFPSGWPLLERWRQMAWLRGAMRRRRYDAVIAFGPVANGLVALARRRGGPLVVVVPNMLSPQVPPVPEDDRNLGRVIAAVGRLAPSKRFGDLIRAFARLGPRAAGWSVAVVGEGESRPRLEALAAELGVADRIRFVGFHRAPWEFLATVELFVLCSQHEGFANALVEAMASGCTVVASDCRFGPRETIEDGVSGILYPVGDVERLTEILGELIENPSRRVSLGRAAAERAQEFTVSAVAARWLQLINDSARDAST